MSSRRVWSVPRAWSNRELARVAPRFGGDIVNVSAWRDEDKSGRRYRDYFPKASSYSLTNFKAEARGLQGVDNEIFLDLAATLPDDLQRKFDVVFNHTTLEHIFDVHRAFANLCAMSRDAVILVVPFLQEQHGAYGDFWRFTPDCVAQLFRINGLTPLMITSNRHLWSSVYVFAVGVRDPAAHADFPIDLQTLETSLAAGGKPRFAGRNSLPPLPALMRWFKDWRRGKV
jgi:hypothetical protein